MSHLMKNYGRLPVSFDHGQGVWLWDKEGISTWMLWQASP